MSRLDRVVAINTIEGEYVMEYQVESERGFHALGSTYFSSYMRLPLDPAHFTDINGIALGERLTDFEVPDNTWVWAWSRWYVDMSSDVDDQGWCYAWHFKSKKWSDRHRFMRSFVRQRLWKRPRVKRYVLERQKIQSYTKGTDGCDAYMERTGYGMPESDTATPERLQISHEDEISVNESQNSKNIVSVLAEKLHIDSQKLLKQGNNPNIHIQNPTPKPADLDLVQQTKSYQDTLSIQSDVDKEDTVASLRDQLSHLRNDRERVDFIYNYIINNPDKTDILVSSRDHIMAVLRFPVSRTTLITMLSQSGNDAAERFALMPNNTWRDTTLLHGEPAVTEEVE